MKRHIYIKLLVLMAVSCNFISDSFSKERRLSKEVAPFQLKTGVFFNDNINPTIVDEDSAAFGGSIGLFGRIYDFSDGFLFSFEYSGDFKRYEVSEDALVKNEDQYDFSGGNLKLSTTFYLSDFWELNTEGAYKVEAESLGKGISKFRRNITKPDVLKETYLGATVTFGKQNYNRNISATISFTDFDYGNNNIYGPLFDYTHATLNVGTKFRRNSRLTFIAQAQYIDEKYESMLRLNNVVYSALAGVEWTPTGKSFLYALFGGYYRDIEDNDPSSSFTWYVTYEYDPREDIALKFESIRTTVAAFDVIAIDTLQEDHIFLAEYFYSEQWKYIAKHQIINSKFREGDRRRTLSESFSSVGIKLMTSDNNDILFELGRNGAELSDGTTDYEQNEVRLTWQYAF